MIKITRTPEPDILKQNKQQWTQTLVDLIDEHGSYANIPNNEKNNAIQHYRHEEIKQDIQAFSYDKCVYCESKISHVASSHIEHFYPKSLYPQGTFDWENLFLACPSCNQSKGNFDTKQNLIVNPAKDNPEDFFIYRDLMLEPIPDSPDKQKSQQTITACDLNRVVLVRQTAEIYCQLLDNKERLSESLSEYFELKKDFAKEKRLLRIRNAVDNLRLLAQDQESYAGFVRYFIYKSKHGEPIRKAIELIKSNDAQNDFI
ncbi:retron system putative HNH endonuclease [Candidatus Albibeggiatoa sp. nov. BB20]|uniref:retron system putative HNH endonuclease n=1 Tax=Candidatus Albibeggiatoa sp. nov. BB20 TaxID=3162723 RepID=UPI0033654E88